MILSNTLICLFLGDDATLKELVDITWTGFDTFFLLVEFIILGEVIWILLLHVIVSMLSSSEYIELLKNSGWKKIPKSHQAIHCTDKLINGGLDLQ